MNQIGKKLWNLGAAIFWGGVVITTILYSFMYLMSTACSTDEYEELYSPNGELRAVVIMTGCGGFSSPQTQIYVERIKNKSLSPFSLKKTDALIRLDGKPDDVSYQIEWETNEKFVISNFDFSKMMAFKNQSWGTELPRIYFAVNGS
ncbi:hypothetical protein CKQ84_17970 [Shewanella sp. WE21]|nr:MULTISPECIES: hypothetical protein [unclassified Shewanella]AVI67595.1 hypothetical protein CKQ84_17970 [Shewanella sp. WE21]MCU8056380.1 hypothetical protein [Shewanella sp. SM35]MCU8065314.1 hypothetical protein [Shewanella sp. SM34]